MHKVSLKAPSHPSVIFFKFSLDINIYRYQNVMRYLTRSLKHIPNDSVCSHFPYLPFPLELLHVQCQSYHEDAAVFPLEIRYLPDFWW